MRNFGAPQHEKLVEEIVEVVQVTSQKHIWVQCNCLTVTFSSVSCCVTKMTNLDEKFTDEEVNETF